MAEKSGDSALYTALDEMGIVRFHEISHYSLRQDGVDKDILRVNYKRAKGSLLPYSRKYKFGRAVKMIVADGGTSRMEQTYEISPFLLKAISELDDLVARNKLPTEDKADNADLKADLLAEIAELSDMVKESDGSGNTASVSGKVENLRRLVESL